VVSRLPRSAPLITAWADDTSYETVFAAQLDVPAGTGDSGGRHKAERQLAKRDKGGPRRLHEMGAITMAGQALPVEAGPDRAEVELW